jgi:hypothetical protein
MNGVPQLEVKKLITTGGEAGFIFFVCVKHPIGFYTVGDKVKTWVTISLFCGSIWMLLFAPALNNSRGSRPAPFSNQ